MVSGFRKVCKVHVDTIWTNHSEKWQDIAASRFYRNDTSGIDFMENLQSSDWSESLRKIPQCTRRSNVKYCPHLPSRDTWHFFLSHKVPFRWPFPELATPTFPHFQNWIWSTSNYKHGLFDQINLVYRPHETSVAVTPEEVVLASTPDSICSIRRSCLGTLPCDWPIAQC